jgi:glyoxylase-like metal-dependent hydrolase (beta-lactamase superfamily II)
VTVPAEPRPITLPLPGGQEGAHVRLRPLLTGEIATPPGFLERLPGRLAGVRGYGLHTRRRHWPWAPVPAFLLEHPGAGPILVDTGLHESLARSKRNVGLAGVLFSFRVGAGQTVRERLQQRGLAVAEIDTVIMTHLHNDHASAVEDFPDSTFVLDRREWEAAWRKAPSFRGYQRRQFDHRFDWRSVDFEAPGVDAFATFGRTLDLFGDGSVRLLSTPGHTPGHMSLLLRLRHREALITVDAAYTRRTIDESVMPLLTDDVHRFRRSLGEIQRYVAQTPGSLVIPGHDAETWRGLDPVYV